MNALLSGGKSPGAKSLITPSVSDDDHKEVEGGGDRKKSGRRAVGGRVGRVVWIQGEVGIGKSSLLTQIQVRHQKAIWFIWGRGSEFDECEFGKKVFCPYFDALGISSEF